MPTLTFEHWGMLLVAAVVLASALGSVIFGFLGWLDRKRERERQLESSGIPLHSQPLHEKFVTRAEFVAHTTFCDARHTGAAEKRSAMHKEIEALDRAIATMQERDQHHAASIKDLRDDIRSVNTRLGLILERLPQKK